MLADFFQRKLNLGWQHALLLRTPLEQLLQEEEPIRPGAVVEAILLDHLLRKRQLLLMALQSVDQPHPKTPSVVILVIHPLQYLLDSRQFPSGVLVILDQESLLLPNLEGLCLFPEAGVGELVLLFDGCVFVVEYVHLFAVPGVVVARIGQGNYLS